MNDILTVQEAANFLKKHPDTIRRWIEGKKLLAKKLAAGKSGVYAILRNDLLEMAVSETIEKKSKAKVRKHAAEPSQQVHLPL